MNQLLLEQVIMKDLEKYKIKLQNGNHLHCNTTERLENDIKELKPKIDTLNCCYCCYLEDEQLKLIEKENDEMKSKISNIEKEIVNYKNKQFSKKFLVSLIFQNC